MSRKVLDESGVMDIRAVITFKGKVEHKEFSFFNFKDEDTLNGWSVRMFL